MMIGSTGKYVGKYTSIEDTIKAAREDFDARIAAGDVIPPADTPFSGDDLVFRERYNDIILPDREF